MPSSPDARDFFGRKINIPAELRTAEWSVVAAWIRERAFFMAAVDNARTLQAFRNQVEEVLQGNAGAAQAREAMRRYLRDTGYAPPPDKDGSLQDLSSNQRLKVSIDTNTALARNWQQRQELLGDMAHPALELYRAGQARQPRNWEARWREAAAAVNFAGVAKGGRMVALTESPIWCELSAFDLPYPPFDFGSHMRVRPVRFSDARELGLFDTPEGQEQVQEGAAVAERGGESLNEHLEVDVSAFAEALLQELQRSLKGLARREGGKLVCADPNGTKPYNWREIGAVITAELPKGMPNLQAQAFKHWVEDSSNFREGRSKVIQVKVDGQQETIKQPIVEEEERRHMARLIHRIEPTHFEDEDGGTISRALHWSNHEGFNEVLKNCLNGTYTAQPGTLGESWNNNELTVQRYANKKNNIILRCTQYRNRRRIDGLYKHIRVDKQIEGLGIATEGESIMPSSAQFRVVQLLSRRKNKLGGYTYEFEVHEI